MLLEISTTVGCPVNCTYCPQDKIGQAYHGPRLLSVEMFSECLSHCSDNICVSFAGYAEPYLNHNCSRMIGIAACRFHPVQIYTTGVGMRDSDVDMLIRTQPHRVVWHMPDSDGQMKVNVTDDYVRRMACMIDKVDGIQTVCYSNLHPRLAGLDRNRQWHQLQTRAGNVAEFSVRGVRHSLPHAALKPLRCAPDPKLENNVLLPTGDLVICCQDYGLRHIVGNLATQNWDEIHTGPVMAAFKAAMFGGDCLCRTCEYAVEDVNATNPSAKC